MFREDPQTLVSTDWLAEHLGDADLRILDGSWHMPATGRSGAAEFEIGHIPGARFFDIDDISDDVSDLPHMVPPIEKFMSKVRKLGVGDGHKIVVYDTAGLFSAARVWWLFKIMGQNNIAVLDGGLPKWQAEGREVTHEPPVIRDRHMTVRPMGHMVRDVTQVSHAAKLKDHNILDARSAARFKGKVPEPREGLRSGHIPSALSVPFTELLNADHTMKDDDALRGVLDRAGFDWSKPTITSCGSGVTAAVINLALERLGYKEHSLYDGSWTEWGQFATLPIATGPA